MGWVEMRDRWGLLWNTSLACGTSLLACALLLSLSPLCVVELVGVGSRQRSVRSIKAGGRVVTCTLAIGALQSI